MARDSLTAFFHSDRKEHVISLYRSSKGAYISTSYIYSYCFFDLDRYDDEEDTIGPKVIVEWEE